MKNKTKKLKISKKVRKFATNPKVEFNARKELDKEKIKREQTKTLNKVGFEYKDRKDVW